MPRRPEPGKNAVAGDWIKMRKSLADDPAVTGLAHTLGITIQEAIGSLYLLWCYADSHAVDGCVAVTPKRYRSVTVENLDRAFCRNGFAETLEEIGWLEVHDDRIAFPKFERHMSQSAKERALTKKRVAIYRDGACNGRPLPEKRREEKNNKSTMGAPIPVAPSGRHEALTRKLIAAVPCPGETDVLAMVAGLVSEGHLPESHVAGAMDDLGDRVTERPIAYFWKCLKVRANPLDVNALMRRVRLPKRTRNPAEIDALLKSFAEELALTEEP